MSSSFMYKINFRMGDMVLRGVLMITCEVFLRYHFVNTRSITLLGSGRGGVDGLGGEI